MHAKKVKNAEENVRTMVIDLQANETIQRDETLQAIFPKMHAKPDYAVEKISKEQRMAHGRELL